MRYAVILTADNTWDYESDRLSEAVKHFERTIANGVDCVLVKVLADRDEPYGDMADIFGSEETTTDG